YPMTDIGGGIFSLIVTAIFLKYWKPQSEWHFTRGETTGLPSAIAAQHDRAIFVAPAAEADHQPLTIGNVAMAWAPYAIMSVMLMLTGLVRQQEARGPVKFGSMQTNY